MLRRALPITALLLAALGFVVVAVDRWWPCAAHGNDSEICFSRQDDSYTGIGTLFGAVEGPILAVACLLVAAAIVLAGRGGHWWPAWLAALPPVAQAYAHAAPSSEGLGVQVALGVLVVFAYTFLVGPIAAASLPTGSGARVRLAYGVGIAATGILVDLFVLAPVINGGYMSHDTTPWAWLPSGLGCLLAAGALTRVRTPSAQPVSPDAALSALSAVCGRSSGSRGTQPA